MIMNNVEKSIDTLSKLRDLGIRSSIDDFGTGYSSFAYLRDLPVDELKVDRQFVSRILSDDGDRQIVETMIALAHAMKLEVVAEGIESNEIASKLKAMGCDIIQGYWLSRPVPADGVQHLLGGEPFDPDIQAQNAS